MADISQITLPDGSEYSFKDAEGRTQLATFVRPNLLDNWYFVGGGSQQGGRQFPINQRGQTSYTGTGYSIDRWRGGSSSTASVLVKSDGVEVIEDFQQIVSLSVLVPGCTYTFSELTSDGRLGSITFTYTTDIDINISDGVSYLVVAAANDYCIFRVYGVGQTLQAVKLELGDTQTLAHHENGVWVINGIPNYEEQLLRCKTSTADGADTYANHVISYDSEVHTGSIGLSTAGWTKIGNRYSKHVSSGLPTTMYTKVDLQPTVSQIEQLIKDGVQALQFRISYGIEYVDALGAIPTVSMTIPCTYYETT